MTFSKDSETEKTSVDIIGIKDLYSSYEPAKYLLSYFAGRKNNSNESTVDRLHAVLVAEGHNVDRSEVIEALRRLEALNCGVFKTGRKGHPTRMVWSVGIVSLGRVAAGEAADVENIDAVSIQEDDAASASRSIELDMMNVTYPLRPDLVVSLALPKNMTQKEATRLADFIKTLPFGDERPVAA